MSFRCLECFLLYFFNYVGGAGARGQSEAGVGTRVQMLVVTDLGWDEGGIGVW